MTSEGEPTDPSGSRKQPRLMDAALDDEQEDIISEIEYPSDNEDDEAIREEPEEEIQDESVEGQSKELDKGQQKDLLRPDSEFPIDDTPIWPGKMLTPHSLTKMRNDCLHAAGSDLSLPQEMGRYATFVALTSCQWNLRKFHNMERLSPDRKVCSVCHCGEADAESVFENPLCGHILHRECGMHFLAIEAERLLQLPLASPNLLLCPVENCGTPLSDSVISLATPEVERKIEKILDKEFIRTYRRYCNRVLIRLIPCPRAGCLDAVVVKTDAPEVVECGDRRFCSECRGPTHSPVTCHAAKEWERNRTQHRNLLRQVQHLTVQQIGARRAEGRDVRGLQISLQDVRTWVRVLSDIRPLVSTENREMLLSEVNETMTKVRQFSSLLQSDLVASPVPPDFPNAAGGSTSAVLSHSEPLTSGASNAVEESQSLISPQCDSSRVSGVQPDVSTVVERMHSLISAQCGPLVSEVQPSISNALEGSRQVDQLSSSRTQRASYAELQLRANEVSAAIEDHGPVQLLQGALSQLAPLPNQNETVRLDVHTSNNEKIINVNRPTAVVKPCPGAGCDAWIEKLSGCDRITCPRCGSLFCWGCLNSYTVGLHVCGTYPSGLNVQGIAAEIERIDAQVAEVAARLGRFLPRAEHHESARNREQNLFANRSNPDQVQNAILLLMHGRDYLYWLAVLRCMHEEQLQAQPFFAFRMDETESAIQNLSEYCQLESPSPGEIQRLSNLLILNVTVLESEINCSGVPVGPKFAPDDK